MRANGDDQIGTRLRAGDLAGDLTAVLDTLRRTVRRVAHSLPRWSVEDAREEVIQRACVRVLKKRTTLRLRDPTKLLAWTRAVARNEWRTFRREVMREAKYRVPDPSPRLEDGEEEDEGLEYYRPSVDRDPVAQTCEDRETLGEVLDAVVENGEHHSRHGAAVVREVLRGMLLGVPNAELALQLHLTEAQLRNLKSHVITYVLAESFPELFEKYTRRGPKRGKKGKKGKSGPRHKAPRGEEEDTGGDLFRAATTVAAHLAC